MRAFTTTRRVVANRRLRLNATRPRPNVDRPSRSRFPAPVCASNVAGLLRGAQHLVDEALGLAGAGAADAARPNAEILAGNRGRRFSALERIC